MNRLAPVSITVYDRLIHLRACISSLLRNPEAGETVVYIFSDAAKPGDEEKIDLVRNYILTITGFAKVETYFQTSNSHSHNIKMAREIPLNDFGRIIRMEDDIVVSPLFLEYMNKALNLFEFDFRIFSISGYLPDFCKVEQSEAFLSKDFSAWGYATWANRNLHKIVQRLDFYDQMNKNPECKHLANRLHPLMLPMLRLVAQGKANPGDYKLTAHQFLTNTFSLKPNVNLVLNIGFDGSGMGGKGRITNRFETVLSKKMPIISTSTYYDPNIDHQLFGYHFQRRSALTFFNKLKLRLYAYIPLVIFRKLMSFKSLLIHYLAVRRKDI